MKQIILKYETIDRLIPWVATIYKTGCFINFLDGELSPHTVVMQGDKKVGELKDFGTIYNDDEKGYLYIDHGKIPDYHFQIGYKVIEDNWTCPDVNGESKLHRREIIKATILEVSRIPMVAEYR